MGNLVGNILAAVGVAVTAIAFEFGALAPGDAFFIAFGILLLYTASQLVARENQPLRQAVVAMLTKPASYSSRGAFAAYVGSAVVGGIVLLQTLTYL